MSTHKALTKAVWDKAHEVASQMDFSGMDAQALLDATMAGFGQLDYLQHEIFDWASQMVAAPPIRENPELLRRALDIAWNALPVVVFFRAVTIAAAREIETRSKTNKTNYYFGLLKLAHLHGIVELQQKAWRHLQRILVSIPYKKGWFHPERKQGWLDVITLAIPELLEKYASLDASSTLKAMAENRFGTVYQRVKARFIDEIRRLKRRVPEIGLSNVGVTDSAPDEGLQRLAVVDLIEEAANDYIEGDPRWGILKKAKALIRNPEQIANNPREIRAEVVRDEAQNRGVSVQQVRRDLREFEKAINADKTLKKVRDGIRTLDLMRIVLLEAQLEEKGDD